MVQYTESALCDRIKESMRKYCHGNLGPGLYYYTNIDTSITLKQTLLIKRDTFDQDILEALDEVTHQQFVRIVTRAIKEIYAERYTSMLANYALATQRIIWRLCI